MERRLWNDLRCGMSNAKILSALREIPRLEGLAAPYFLEASTQSATWQWGMTIDGEFLAGAAVVPDPAYVDRGWLCAYPGELLESIWQIMPLIRLTRDLQRLGPYREMRAWILDGAEVEERFASWMGFRLDCGPASGLSPMGRDMNLWLWRR